MVEVIANTDRVDLDDEVVGRIKRPRFNNGTAVEVRGSEKVQEIHGAKAWLGTSKRYFGIVK